jgi:hypothetical protein
MNWDHTDMSELAIQKRLRAKAPRRKFSALEERILSGWVIYRDLSLQNSTTEIFREFAYTYFRRSMSPSFITKFMKRNRLSLKLVAKADSDELRQENIDEAIDFLPGMEALVMLNGMSASSIKVMDKTYLMTSPWHTYIRQMGPRGSSKSRRQCPQRGRYPSILLCVLFFFFCVCVFFVGFVCLFVCLFFVCLFFCLFVCCLVFLVI